MSPDGFGKPPPEEKLLKLIRGRHPRPVSQTAMPIGGPALAGPAVRTMPGSAAALRGLVWPTVTAWLLGGLLGVEAVVLVLQAVRSVKPVPMPVAAVSVIEPAAPAEPAPPAAPDLPSVSQSVARPLFAATTAASPAAAAPSAAATAIASKLTMRLTLMGIVAGDQPQAIIEDSESKKTFLIPFVRRK